MAAVQTSIDSTGKWATHNVKGTVGFSQSRLFYLELLKLNYCPRGSRSEKYSGLQTSDWLRLTFSFKHEP